MTPVRMSQTSASAVAIAFHDQAVRGGMYAATFAQRLADAYHTRFPDIADRSIEFKIGTTAESQISAMKANAKMVERFCKGTLRIPLDLLEAWADALPEALGLEFRREMARRLGFIGALPPQESAPAADVGTLAAEFGQTMQALAPLLADGRIDSADCPALVRKALAQGTDLMASWMTMQQALIAALPSEVKA